MIKRGPKPKRIIEEKWTSNFAYAIGLLASDGCLASDGLLIDLTSKDREQLLNFSKCLGVNFHIGTKHGKASSVYSRIQFKNRLFYDFLLSVGLSSKKSLTLGKLKIPEQYFFDFLRGSFDGDGSFYSYWDSRWKSSHMFYIQFISASKKHIDWLQDELRKQIGVIGHINQDGKRGVFQLKYAKNETLEIIKKMYYSPNVVCLSRKYLKIKKALDIEKNNKNNI